MTSRKPDLDSAFAMTSPAESVALYRDWADTYDAGFAAPMGYRLPSLVAEAFAAGQGAGPVLDVGAGTGLVAERLAALGIGPVDAVDISPDMLAIAATKGHYRVVMVADLYQGVPVPDGSYRGITSSGTFTHGHVGPRVFDELLRLAAPGALFALSINLGVYHEQGFATKLAELGPRITGLHLADMLIYDTPDKAHEDQRALIVTFRKA
jgi:predicted TPR repeat methyltransferase